LLSDEALSVKAQENTVFARCSPDQKERIISSLRSHQDVVGYMGDGINDAPSLKTADVGISVDTAVDIAKESADLVLTKKSLKDLQEGVVEGRKTFGNTMKYVMMALSSNFGNIFSAAGAVIFLPFLPMLPAQILLNNLIYDFSQVTIPSDKVDKSWVQKPKRWNLVFVKKFMYVFGPLSSLFDFLMFFILFLVIKSAGGALIDGESVFQTGWFMMSLATQTLVVHVIRTKEMPFVKSRASALLTISTVACLIVGWTLPYTALGVAFRFVPMPYEVVLLILGVVLLYLITVEFVKRLFFKKYDF
jgi:P-type Mg2+ transporter